MTAYSYNDIVEIQKKNDIVDVFKIFLEVINFDGMNWCECPFHDDDGFVMSRAKVMYISKEKQKFRCYHCNANGDVFTIVMKMRNCTLTDAVKFLAERINYVCEV